MISDIPSSFQGLHGAASAAFHREPGLSLVLKCGWTGTPGRPAPALVWPPPSLGYAPSDWRSPCPEVGKKFWIKSLTFHKPYISFIHSCPGQSSSVLCLPLALAEPLWANQWRDPGCQQPGPSCRCSLTAGCTVRVQLLVPISSVWTGHHSWGQESGMTEAG